VTETETETVTETVTGFTWSRWISRTPDSGPRTPDPGILARVGHAHDRTGDHGSDGAPFGGSTHGR